MQLISFIKLKENWLKEADVTEREHGTAWHGMFPITNPTI